MTQTIKHTSGKAGGYLVGRKHTQGGIKAVNKSTGQPLEMEGGEVVITAPAVADNKKRLFNGKLMTNRQILSEINVSGGGVAFADGGEVPKSIKPTGKTYRYGGKVMRDTDIVQRIMRKYPAEFKRGLSIETKEHSKTLRGLADKKIQPHEALTKMVAEHLKENPNYYKNYSHGGYITVVNKQFYSYPTFIKKVSEVKSPFSDEPNVVYKKIADMRKDEYVFSSNGRLDGKIITCKLAYQTWLYDEYDIILKNLPDAIQKAIWEGKQNIVDKYINQ